MPEPTAWKPRTEAGTPPIELLPEPTAWKPAIPKTAAGPDSDTQDWSQIAWNAAGWAGAAAIYTTLGYLIYHNFRIGARLHDIDMWAKSLQGRIPSADEIIANTYVPIGEIAGVLFLGDDDYLGDRDEWDIGITLTPTSRAYQAMHLADTRLQDWGFTLKPIVEGDPPPMLQEPPRKILTHDDVANLYDKVAEYQALERVSEGDVWDRLLQQ